LAENMLRFCKSAPYTILYKTSMEGTEFKSLDLSPTCRGRPPKFEKITLAPLYHDGRPIIYKKYKDGAIITLYISCAS